MTKIDKHITLLFVIYLALVITLYEVLPSIIHFRQARDFSRVYVWLLIVPSGLYGFIGQKQNHRGIIGHLLILSFAQVFAMYDAFNRIDSLDFSEFGAPYRSPGGLCASVLIAMFGAFLGYLAWLISRWIKRLYAKLLTHRA